MQHEPRTYPCIPFPRPLEVAPGKPPSFQDWLMARYGYSPRYFYCLCVRTGKPSDYYRAMDWYRRRYRHDMALRLLLLEGIPFD